MTAASRSSARSNPGCLWRSRETGQYETAETTLEPGDVVILYTDGVTDAFNPQNERFGDAGLHSMLTKAPAGPAAAGEMLVQQVRAHAAGRSQFDDITMVAFGRREGGEE